MSNARTGSPTDFTPQWGHPKPLWMLFMTEFWERFCYYGMRWALTLYIVAAFFGGDPAGPGQCQPYLRRLHRPGLRHLACSVAWSPTRFSASSARSCWAAS